MFNKEKEKAPMTAPSFNILSSDAELKGDITTSGDFRIDGKLRGSIICKGKLTLGITGYIEGRIECENAEISGKIDGDITSLGRVSIKDTAIFNGKIVTRELSVEPTIYAGSRLTMDCVTMFQEKEKESTLKYVDFEYPKVEVKN